MTGTEPENGADGKFARSWIYRHRGLIGRVLLVPTGLIAALSPAPFPEGSAIDAVFDALGWMVLLAGGGLRLWATLYIGGRKSGSIVCDGPYSMCRNPLYLGSFLMAASGGFFLQSAPFLAASLLMALVYDRGTVRNEEAFMRATFDRKYLDYAAQTPRYLPRFSRFRTERFISVDVYALWRECRRAAVWVLIPIAVEILEILRSQPWWQLPA